LGCAVEGDSSSHHGGRHGAGNNLVYGIRTYFALERLFLIWQIPEQQKVAQEFIKKVKLSAAELGFK
jgi:hypothetical protein